MPSYLLLLYGLLQLAQLVCHRATQFDPQVLVRTDGLHTCVASDTSRRTDMMTIPQSSREQDARVECSWYVVLAMDSCQRCNIHEADVDEVPTYALPTYDKVIISA
jgi:hypothetical protein